MIKKTVIVIGLFLIFIVAAFYIWLKLPVSINRRNDIKFGEGLISRIENYRKKNGLPENNDWTTLKLLGFKDRVDFFIPEYQKINDTTYELVFIEGFDGPYLLWNSKDKRWKKAHPTIVITRLEKKVFDLVGNQTIVKEQIKLVDSLSLGKRRISLVPILDDTTKNIYLVKVVEDNGTNYVTYFNFFVDGNTFTIINPSGKLEGQ